MGEHFERGRKRMIKLFAILVLIFTIAYSGWLIIRVIPVVKLSLKIKKLKRQIRKLSRIWKKVEKEFVRNEQFRESFINDPNKLGVFFETVDKENGTDFCKGLTSKELSGLFRANPDVMAVRAEEYLCYRQAVRI